jgi:hypothetical protein
MSEYPTELFYSCAPAADARKAADRLVKFLEELDADATGEVGDEPDYDPLQDARAVREALREA